MSEELERFTPGLDGEIWYEHWHRYHFASPLAAGKRVLDIACGEGYGSALLSHTASSVIGIDADAAILGHARRRYGGSARLQFLEGRCEALPLPNACVDLVVSFETLEHVAEPHRLLDEAARVLTADGTLVVSTPNKEVYSDRPGYANPFHLKELYRDEFLALLRERFAHAAFFGQRVDTFSAIWPMEPGAARAQVVDVRKDEAEAVVEGRPADPMYFLAVCGRDAATVDAARGVLSLLADREHRVAAAREALRARMQELVAHVNRIEGAYLASQDQLAAALRERDQLAERLRQLQAAAPAWKPK